MKALHKIAVLTLAFLVFAPENASATPFDERGKPGDDKKSKPAPKKDDTTCYEMGEDLLDIADTALITFPSNDLYATWDTARIHPYNFADCFRLDSVVLILT